MESDSKLVKINRSAFLSELLQYPITGTYWIALSGGCDSISLLHLMSQVRDELIQKNANLNIKAVHVHHGLSAKADEWLEFCQQQCDALDIPLQHYQVNAQARRGQSPEEAARTARYEVFTDILKANDMILLAQHANDQVETLFLQLLRGAGPQGQSAMPVHRNFAAGALLRPLLKYSRADIEQYARQHNLTWVHDDSNDDDKFDRNFLRLKVLPVLEQRWPSYMDTIGRSIELNANSAELLVELASVDYETAKTEDKLLDISKLAGLSDIRVINLLRYWISVIHSLPGPNKIHLEHIISDVINAKQDANPHVTWAGAEVRRYRDCLYASRPQTQHDHTQTYAWRIEQDLLIADLDLTLSATKSIGSGLAKDMIDEELSVRFRQGGESCCSANKQHRTSLKNLFQEWGVPNWQRDRIPLIYVGQEIAQVLGYCVCAPFQAAAGEQGIEVIGKLSQ